MLKIITEVKIKGKESYLGQCSASNTYVRLNLHAKFMTRIVHIQRTHLQK